VVLCSIAGTCDLDLLARPRAINEVVQQDDLLVARQAPRLHAARALLQRQLLVVPVHRLRRVHLRAGTTPVLLDRHNAHCLQKWVPEVPCCQHPVQMRKERAAGCESDMMKDFFMPEAVVARIATPCTGKPGIHTQED